MKNYNVKLLLLCLVIYSTTLQSGWKTAQAAFPYINETYKVPDGSTVHNVMHEKVSLQEYVSKAIANANNMNPKLKPLFTSMQQNTGLTGAELLALIDGVSNRASITNDEVLARGNCPVYFDPAIFNAQFWLKSLATVLTVSSNGTPGKAPLGMQGLTSESILVQNTTDTNKQYNQNYVKHHFMHALNFLGSYTTTTNVPTKTNSTSATTITYQPNYYSSVAKIMVSTIINNTKETFEVIQKGNTIGLIKPGINEFPLYGAAQSSGGDITFQVINDNSSKQSWTLSFKDDSVTVKFKALNSAMSFIDRTQSMSCLGISLAARFTLKIEDFIVISSKGKEVTAESNFTFYPSIMCYSLERCRPFTSTYQSVSYSFPNLTLPTSLQKDPAFSWVYLSDSMIKTIQTDYTYSKIIAPHLLDNTTFITKTTDVSVSKKFIDITRDGAPVYFSIPNIAGGKMNVYQVFAGSDSTAQLQDKSSSDIPTTSALQSYITTLQKNNAMSTSFENNFGTSIWPVSTKTPATINPAVTLQLTKGQVPSSFSFDTTFKLGPWTVGGLGAEQTQSIQAALQSNNTVAIQLDPQPNSAGTYDVYVRGYILDKGLWFKFIKIFEQKFSSLKAVGSNTSIKAANNPLVSGILQCTVNKKIKKMTDTGINSGMALFYIYPPKAK